MKIRELFEDTSWTGSTLRSFRETGRPFFASDLPEIKPGYYYFVNPTDDDPVGPFSSSREAEADRNKNGAKIEKKPVLKRKG